MISGFLFCQAPTTTQGESEEAAGKVSATGNNEFAFKLYDLLKHKDGNIFFSPCSIRTALAMTLSGARKRTASQMEKALCLTGKEEVPHRAIAALASGLDTRAGQYGHELKIANSLWGLKGYRFLPEFLGSLKKIYGAGFNELDFRADPENAYKTINRWVEGKTDSRIRELLKAGDLDPATVLVLINAIWFKAHWACRFDESNTRERPFFLPGTGKKNDGPRKISVPFMYQMSDFGCLHDKDMTILELPYEGNELTMVIILPREREGLAGLEASLTSEALLKKLQKLEPQEIGVFLPKFKANSRFYMRETLSALGMADAFDSTAADFSGMTGSGGLWIDNVIHEAVVEVDEQGTRAAGATAVMMKKGGMSFHADHPFMFLIRDKNSGAILFLGRVADPS